MRVRSDRGAPAIAGIFRRPSGALSLLSVAGVLFVVVPIVAFASYVLAHLSSLTFRGVSSPVVVSITATTVAVVIGGLVGVPLGYALNASQRRAARLIGLLVRLPLGLPPLSAGLLLLLALGPYTLLGRATGGSLIDTFAGVIVAEGFVSLPFIVETARASFASGDEDARRLARSMGMGAAKVFLLIAVPDAWRGLRIGLTLGWLRAFGEFGATILVAYHPYALPVFTYVQFSGAGLPSATGVVLVTMLAASIGSVLLISIRYPLRVAIWALARTRWPSSHTDIAEATSVPSGEGLSFYLQGRVGTFRYSFRTQAPVTHLGVVGYSGSGKSALLSALVGCGGPVRVDASSSAQLGGRDLWRDGVRLSWVPQGSGLFGGYRVHQQLEIARLLSGAGRSEMDEVITTFELGDLLRRSVRELSGGQRQLVALARAVLLRPQILLLDEAFSAMDTPLRARVMRVVSRIVRERGIALVLVTHDISEALWFGDSIMVVADGQVMREGTGMELLEDPGDRPVAELVGFENIVRANLFRDDADESESVAIRRSWVRCGPEGRGVRAVVIEVHPFPEGLVVRAQTDSGELIEAVFDPLGDATDLDPASLYVGRPVGLTLRRDDVPKLKV